MLLQIFKSVAIEDICKEVLALDASKATQNNDMPTKIIKNNSDFFSSTFPEKLKYADEESVFKKDS